MLTGPILQQQIENCLTTYLDSQLKNLVDLHGPYVIKFVNSQWAAHYTTSKPLKISETPALTWGTATYVTPLAYSLSSALYGRIGLVTKYDPTNWKIFDATDPYNRMLYIKWVERQAAFEKLVTTVHSTIANHSFRDKFRRVFSIDCVLFHPDQEADYYTHSAQHVWMAVTDWAAYGIIDTSFSRQLSQARFTVLIDEDFMLKEKNSDLPIAKSPRQIEEVTETLHLARHTGPLGISRARTNAGLSTEIRDRYDNGGYLHIFIEP